ncbi:MAG: DNA replication/repair protein RecF [Thermoleophilia bacterium]
MYVAQVRLTGFRSYSHADITFTPGLNVIVGENATGKTNLLEGAYYALRGSSPRTRRDDKLLTWGAQYARATARLHDDGGGEHLYEVTYAPGQGKSARVDGSEVEAGDDLRARSQVFIFVPESLLLVKGSPARRRAHIDAFAAACLPAYRAAHSQLSHVLRQRNAQLARLRDGGPAEALDPWDAQLARVAVELERRRRDIVARLAAPFAAAAAALAPGDSRFALRLVTQLNETGDDEAAVLAVLRSRRSREVARGISTFGPHRDDLLFVEVGGRDDVRLPAAATHGDTSGMRADAGATLPPGCASPAAVDAAGDRDLRLFGSQGEQRAAVLALLLAEQGVAADLGGDRGILFLDDVMSELDDSRRRLLVRALVGAGQALVTTTNGHYFSAAELADATVIELPLTNADPQGVE